MPHYLDKHDWYDLIDAIYDENSPRVDLGDFQNGQGYHENERTVAARKHMAAKWRQRIIESGRPDPVNIREQWVGLVEPISLIQKYSGFLEREEE